MARDYYYDYVETSASGQPRYVRETTKTQNTRRTNLRRSNTHDGSSQSSRSRRVDFVDVTRKEYKALLARERSLVATNEQLSSENWALRANYETCCEETQRLQRLVRDLEYENSYLRSSGDGGGYHTHDYGYGGDRNREDEMRKLRNKHTRLRNDYDSLLAKLKNLERGVRGGIRDGARHIRDDLSHWKHKVTKLEDENEQLNHKLDAAQRRCQRLEAANASLSRQEMAWRREVDSYESYLRRHGLTVR